MFSFTVLLVVPPAIAKKCVSVYGETQQQKRSNLKREKKIKGHLVEWPNGLGGERELLPLGYRQNYTHLVSLLAESRRFQWNK